MKNYLCVGERYEKDGAKKTSWKRIGEIFEGKNGKTYVKIYHMPGTLISVFEDEKPNQSKSNSQPGQDEFGADMEVPF